MIERERERDGCNSKKENVVSKEEYRQRGKTYALSICTKETDSSKKKTHRAQSTECHPKNRLILIGCLLWGVMQGDKPRDVTHSLFILHVESYSSTASFFFWRASCKV